MQFLLGILLLAVLIFFHELGHFLFAKLLGVRVLVFSLGFGPKILKKKIGVTEYCISAIPLGGYVRMFGESFEENLSIEEKKISFIHQPTWRKSLIAFAGPLLNFILPVILLFFMFLGTQKFFAPVIGTLVSGGVAEKAGLLPGDKIIKADDKTITTFNDIASYIAKNPNKNIKLNIDRKATNLDINVVPEENKEKVGRIGIMPSVEGPIIILDQNSPYQVLGMKNFDEVIKIDEHVINSIYDLKKFWPRKAESNILLKHGDGSEYAIKVHPIKNDEKIDIKEISKIFIDQKIEKNIIATKDILNKEIKDEKRIPGLFPAQGVIMQINETHSLPKLLALGLLDKILSIDGERLIGLQQLQQAIIAEKSLEHVFGIRKANGEYQIISFKLTENIFDKMDLKSNIYDVLGFKVFEDYKAGEMVEEKVGPFLALNNALKETYSIAFLTGKSLWLLLKGEVPASQLGGPIMLFDVAKDAAEKGFSYYIFIMCMLSVNLGLLNLLPIPALDGGHLLLFSIEAIKGKPLSARTRAIVTQIGIILLLMVMAMAIFNDLSRLFRK